MLSSTLDEARESASGAPEYFNNDLSKRLMS